MFNLHAGSSAWKVPATFGNPFLWARSQILRGALPSNSKKFRCSNSNVFEPRMPKG